MEKKPVDPKNEVIGNIVGSKIMEEAKRELFNHEMKPVEMLTDHELMTEVANRNLATLMVWEKIVRSGKTERGMLWSGSISAAKGLAYDAWGALKQE